MHILKEYIKWVFIECEVVRLKHHDFAPIFVFLAAKTRNLWPFLLNTLAQKTSTFAKPTEQRFALSTGCSLKYMWSVQNHPTRAQNTLTYS